MPIKIIFYLFAALLVIAALRVITVKNSVHAALFLVLAFFSAAAIWLLLYAEFLALTLVLVYVGAVMVLFLFVVMMLDINFAALREGFARYLPLGLGVGVLILFELYWVLHTWQHAPVADSNQIVTVEALGRQLYTTYVYPFEIAAAILLVAMIAAIALTLRPHNRARYQNPSQQVTARPKERIRIVNMPSEPKDD